MAIIDTTQNIVLTTYGEERKNVAITDKNNPIPLMYLAVGDANGLLDFTISKDQTYLINEVWRGRIISMQNLEGDYEGTTIITGYIPQKECGANYLKEYGIFDTNNNLIFVGKLNNYYKPSATAENAVPVVIQVNINWGYKYGLSLYSANEYTYATKKDLMDLDETVPTNRGAFIYFMSGPGRRQTLTSSTGGSTRIKKVNTTYDAQSIISGDYLLVTAPMTIRLPIIKGANIHVKRTYTTGNDLLLTTPNPNINKIDGAESIVISGYMDSLQLFCDGTNWYVG